MTLVDGKTKAALDPQDYRWIIEEDRTFYVDPNCTTNPPPAGCPGNPAAESFPPTAPTSTPVTCRSSRRAAREIIPAKAARRS